MLHPKTKKNLILDLISDQKACDSSFLTFDEETVLLLKKKMNEYEKKTKKKAGQIKDRLEYRTSDKMQSLIGTCFRVTLTKKFIVWLLEGYLK